METHNFYLELTEIFDKKAPDVPEPEPEPEPEDPEKEDDPIPF